MVKSAYYLLWDSTVYRRVYSIVATELDALMVAKYTNDRSIESLWLTSD